MPTSPDTRGAHLIAATSSTSKLSLLSPSHVVNIAKPCRLLDVTTPVRSLTLDYVDDCTAIRYLRTCRTLHAGYHGYSVKQAMSVATFMEVTRLPAYLKYERVGWFAVGYLTSFLTSWFFGFLLIVIRESQLRWQSGVILCALIVIELCVLTWLRLFRRVECCVRGRWGMWRRRYVIPRVTKLSEPLGDLRLLRYLQHVMELETWSSETYAIGKQYTLPRSLRTLRLLNSPDLTLEPDTLPPHLTSLSLSAVKNKTLLTGVLPQSLTSLHLMSGFSTELPIGVDVLPVNLRRLKVDAWTLPLSHTTLPAPLIELHIDNLSDHPLPVLPPHLEVLTIGGLLSQPLRGVLPSTLRVLKLTGKLGHPLTADMFACTPQLEELHLSDKSMYTLVVHVRDLPRSVRVVGLGECRVYKSDATARLNRLVVPAWWDVERVAAQRQLVQAQGFTVEQHAE